MKRLFVSSCVALCAAFVHAETFVWTGADDAYWTNAANWTVSGAAASRCPGAVKMADTAAMWTAMDAEADTAIFDETGVNPSVGSIDLDGQLAVSHVIFRGATAHAYVFGKPTTKTDASAQRLGIHGGAEATPGEVVFESTLGTAPVFTTGLRPFEGVKGEERLSVDFVNNSAVTFDTGKSWGCMTRSTASGNIWLTYATKGTGSFAIGSSNGNNYPAFWYFNMYQQGSVRIYGGIGSFAEFNLRPQVAGTMQVEITETGSVGMYNHGWTYLQCLGGIGSGRIFGDGLITLQSRQGSLSPAIRISSGQTLELACKTLRVTSDKDWWIDTGFGGTLRIGSPAAATFTSSVVGQLQLRGGSGTVESYAVGAPGEAPFGNGSRIYFGGGDTFAYVGAGEGAGRTFALTNFSATAGNATGRLSQRGTGAWTVSGVSDLSWSGKANTLYLENDTEFEAKIARALVEGAGTLAVVKTGAGKWTVSGANAYTGATTLEGGTLALDATQTIASLVVNGDAALAIADGATVTVSALSRTAGTLDVRTTGTGKLIVNGAAFGAAEAWLTINGQAANVQSDGTITAADHTWTSNLNIPARGGVIPTTATDADVVGITTDGTGDKPITLEAEAGATIKGLVQKTAADATVSLAEGQTLTTGLLAIEPTAGSLTIGLPDVALAESGAFAVSGTKLTLDVGNADETLFINAPFDKSGKTLAKTGDGAAEVVLAGGETATGSIAEGTLAFTNGTTRLQLASGEEGFANFEQAVDAEGTLFTTKWVAGSTAPLVMGGTTGVGQTNVINAQNGRVDILGSDTFLRASQLTVRPISNTATTSTVVIADHAYVALDENNVISVGGYPQTGYSDQDHKKGWGELTVSNATLATSKMPTDSWTAQNHGLFLGNDWGPGILRVYDGAVVTNRIRIGRWSWYGRPAIGSGAWYQYGGRTCANAQIGISCYGYLELHPGATITGSASIGTQGANGSSNRGHGAFVMYGGNFEMGGTEVANDNASREAYTTIYQAGGYLRFGTSLYIGRNQSCNTTFNYTQADGTSSCYYVTVYGNSNPIYFNLLGGSFAMSSYYEKLRTGATLYMNYNGGTFKPAPDGSWKTVDWGSDYVTRHTVYAKGLTIDGDACNGQSFRVPFQSAPGKGLASVELATEALARRYIGAPAVVIEGDGTGATAQALVDSRTGALTNIVVTSPGWNYTTATARLWIYESTVVSGLACTLADNARGGLTYKSPLRDRSLTLDSTNDFAFVRVQSGMLKKGMKASFPEDADAIIEGGMLNMGTNDIVFASLSGTGGTLKGTATDGKLVVTTVNPGTGLTGVAFQDENGGAATLKQTTTGAWTVDVADLVAGKTVTIPGELAFGADATLTITGDLTKLDPKARYTVLEATAGAFTGMPTWTNASALPGWQLNKVGGKLRFFKSKGFVMVIR